jgi:O-antigen/teichoic acid export membrane protein
VGNALAFGLTLFFALRYARIRLQFSRSYWKEIVVTALPYGAALVLNMVYFRIDSLMLLFMVGEKQVAFYSPAVRILEILSVVPVYFMNSVLPTLSRAVQVGAERARRVLQLSFDFLFILGVPMVVGLFLLSYPLIALLTQPEFLSQVDAGFFGSDSALKILVFAMFFAFMNSLFTYSLIAVNRQNHLLWINGSAAVLNIVANYFVIPTWSFRGAAATSVLTEAFILLMAFLVARRSFAYKLDFGVMAKVLVSAGCMGTVVYFVRDPLMELGSIAVVLVSLLGVLVYGALLLLLRAVPREFLKRSLL